VRNRWTVAVCMVVGMGLVQVSGAQTATAPAAPTTEPSVLNFLQPDHATIVVNNIELERDWYIRVFGATVLRKVDNTSSQMMMIQLPGYRIDLLRPTPSAKGLLTQPQSPHLGWIHVNFSLPPEEIEGALAVLKARGTDVRPSPFAVQANKEHAGQVWLLQLHDPEGNEIEIVARGYY
jgi:catechol 2,3-dioxygenase-like lactoylglutathione lyase family enzyme